MSISSKDLREMTQTAADVLGALNDVPNYRTSSGVSNRNKQIITWNLPNGVLVQMYINPESLVIAESKQISQIRTKGGYVIQYWGDNLTKLTLTGTTGSSGVKGINVLRDVYHSENRCFETIAASQSNELFNALENSSVNDELLGSQLVPKVSQTLRDRNFAIRPSLGSLAVGVTMIYQGAQYKGFFTDMQVTENVERLGLFSYQISFVATQIMGSRNNFMAWHREPLADDMTGQLTNAIIGGVGNAVRGMFGLPAQQNSPYEFHPESAPLTFGGNSLASQFGIEQTGMFDNSGTKK